MSINTESFIESLKNSNELIQLDAHKKESRRKGLSKEAVKQVQV